MTDKTEARERFERVILPRVDKAAHAVELIGNGASRDYETTPDEIAELLNGLQQKLWEVQRRYARRLGVEVTIFDAAEDGQAEGERGVAALVAARSEPPAPAATLALAPEGERVVATVRGLKWAHVPLVAAELDAALVAPLVTHLIARLDDMANGRTS